MSPCFITGTQATIIDVEDRYYKVAKQFSRVLTAIWQAAERGDAVHEVEEATYFGLIEKGREMIAAARWAAVETLACVE